MEILFTKPSASEYINLRKSSGMGGEKSLNRTEIALKNSLFIVSIYDNNKLIGFGRIVGDGAITYVVSDIMVDKSYQGKGLGKIIMAEIDKYFEENCNEEAYISLIANKPADKLYFKFKFDYLKDFEVAMKRKK
ncbi:GNAT family N-acetyltransferase [Miniphocaeibacter halophilus]|uniref:GNAT family N-acetyltransferase n=1 Tax=Miniphocaeibacter halophilus TaxID=2931922 RepID=A0AC61MTK4_9FIRM|nr:GNAT family N-acetyltransferase [Miniphocaeibacter halophilus]QQK08937.1 GNAT family N-acetyltransferase [Miniphocaeibacter halophilus]